MNSVIIQVFGHYDEKNDNPADEYRFYLQAD